MESANVALAYAMTIGVLERRTTLPTAQKEFVPTKLHSPMLHTTGSVETIESVLGMVFVIELAASVSALMGTRESHAKDRYAPMTALAMDGADILLTFQKELQNMISVTTTMREQSPYSSILLTTSRFCEVVNVTQSILERIAHSECVHFQMM